jgi:transmembrane sensor
MPNIPHDAGPDGEAPADPNDPVDWDAVARHLAGEGTPAERDAMHRWLDANPAEAATIRALDATLDRLAPVAASAADVDVEAALRRVRARRHAEDAASGGANDRDVIPLRTPRVHTRPAASRWRSPALRAAAAVAVVAGGAAIWQQAADRPSAAGARSYETAVGERDSLRLSDGTRVVLGPASTLETDAGYGGARREVRLRGEAYFDVPHDATRPFVVRTATASIEDLGTAFVVRSGADGRVSVAVTQGAVRLGPAAVRSADTGVVLRQGDRGALTAGGQLVAERGVASADDLAWTSGRLVFDDAPAAEVAEAMRRWYGVELRFADAALAERHLTASFRGEPVADVLRVIELALGARVERRGDTVVVRSTPAGAGTP